jgi:hypothetical protein
MWKFTVTWDEWRRVADGLDLRREVEDELAQILIRTQDCELAEEQGVYAGGAGAAFRR